ncbi:hypothetical protein V8C37DRAFT_413632 [Trichoderma ceciliae]
MDSDSIIDWINELGPTPDPASLPEITSLSLPNPAAPNTARKRKTSFASPPPSCTEGDDNMTSTPQKRRRLRNEDEFLDPDATPRPGARSTPSSAASISSQASSTQSSIKGQFMGLLTNDAVDYVTVVGSVPEVAKKLFETMEAIGDCLHILPNAFREAIKNNEGLTEEAFNTWTPFFKLDDKPDNLPGWIPPIAKIKDIIKRTAECTKHFEEAARPHRAFKPISSLAKMIDLCIYAVFDENLELMAAIKAFSRTMPTQSTKQTREGHTQAQLQIGVWHAAQWAFLRWGVRQKLLKQSLAQGLDAPTDDFKAETLKVLSKVGFIPGMLVNGENWSYVFSTYNDGKTTLFIGSMFGNTKFLKKIYCIVAGVRELTAWGRDEYLPWFKENILTLES